MIRVNKSFAVIPPVDMSLIMSKTVYQMTVLVYPSVKKFPSAGVCPVMFILTLRGSQKVLPLIGSWSIPK
jgi:hypothetical protein